MKEGEDSRSTAEFDRSLSPLRVLDILLNLVDAELESDDSDGIGVSLSKDRPQSGNLLSSLEVDLLRVNLDVLLDPLVRLRFDLLEVGGRDGGFVGEIESEFGGSDEGSFLVDVVTENFSEAVVEDVSSGVVVAKGPSSELSNKNRA
jgi:hypothetical protein